MQHIDMKSDACVVLKTYLRTWKMRFVIIIFCSQKLRQILESLSNSKIHRIYYVVSIYSNIKYTLPPPHFLFWHHQLNLKFLSWTSCRWDVSIFWHLFWQENKHYSSSQRSLRLGMVNTIIDLHQICSFKY